MAADLVGVQLCSNNEKQQLVIVSVQGSDHLTPLRRPTVGWCSAVLEELPFVHLVAACACICHFNYSFSAKK